MEIKHKCEDCAEKRKKLAEWSKYFAEKCQCKEKGK